MSNVDALINEILKHRPELTRERVTELATKRKEDLPSISEYTAILLVAVDLGVKLSLDVPSSTPIGRLVEGLNNVTIRGRLVWLKGEKQFKRRDGQTGLFIRGGLGDSTGLRGIIFWDRPQKNLEDSGALEGSVVEISFARTRSSITGDLEIHIGLRSEVKDLPDEDENYPTMKDFLMPLSEVSPDKPRVHTYGKVMSEPLVTEFTREGGESGVVARYRITDGSIYQRIVLWNEVVDEYSWIKPGTTVAIFNGRPKLGLNEAVEVHIGKVSHLTPMPELRAEVSYTPTLLKDLKPGFNMARVYVRVDAVGKKRVSSTNKPIVSIHVSDSSGDATITFIGRGSEEIGKVSPGALLSIDGMRLRVRGEESYLLCDESSKVELNPISPEGFDVPLIDTDLTPLADISVFHKVVNLEGVVVKAPIEEEASVSGFQPIGELYIEQDGKPAKITYRGSISDYAVEELEVNDRVEIYGAWVDASSLIGSAHYLPLRLRAYSRIRKVQR